MVSCLAKAANQVSLSFVRRASFNNIINISKRISHVFARHQNPFLPELLAAHLVWVPESVLHVNGVFSSRSTSASYRQASYTHLLFVIFDTTPKLYNTKKARKKQYCQDCICCSGSFSDCHVTFINLHDLSLSISQIFLAIVNIVDHRIGKGNLREVSQ